MSSLWLSDNKFEHKNTLDEDLSTDICVIGGGIFGTTCAYYLTKLGYNVVLLEKEQIGSKTTGNTTGKITSQHGLFYNYLYNSYGEQFAKDYLDANEQAIANIKNIIDEEKINCDFSYQNNYVYTTKKENLEALKKEFNTLSDIGFNCDLVTKTGLPFKVESALCFKNQAQFNPIKYLAGLCKCISKRNGLIYTNTMVIDVKTDGNDYLVFTKDHKIRASYVIVATHYPFINFPGFYFAKMYQSTSYLIALDPKKTLSKGMYISEDNPTLSFRTAPYNGKEILLVGGAEHRTGEPSCYADTYGLLENEARKYYPDCEILFKWNTRDCISLDKIPYIGQYSSVMTHMYVGTGFKKWGMTLSNIASNIIVDLICKNQNKFAYLFNPSRLKPIKNRTEMKNMLVKSTDSLLLNKLRPANMNFEEIKNDSGSIIEVNSQKVGIYKDSNRQNICC